MIWDEFAPVDCGLSPSFILRLVDRYALTVEIKGGTINFNVPYIIFTSNVDPATWFDSQPDHKDAWLRRLTACAVIHMCKKYKPVVKMEFSELDNLVDVDYIDLTDE